MSGGNILIVDDDRAITHSLARLLSREGYYVEERETAEGALAAIATETQFDLAILDVGLPRRNGFECCQEMRAHGWNGAALMLTGRSGTHDRVRGLDAGADDYLIKPIDPAELLARVRAHLRRCRDYNIDQGISRIDLDDRFYLDLERRDALKDGNPVGLTDREYELLLLLARRRGEALAKKFLFNQIWGCTPDNGIKALTVYVHRIRQKIERDPDDPRYLLTARGYGYRLARGSAAA